MGKTKERLAIFEGSWRKLARARMHIANAKRQVDRFESCEPYKSSIEEDDRVPDQRVHKLKLTMPLPGMLPETIGDAAANLRAALDYSCYAIADIAGLTAKHPNWAWHFPFSRGGPDTFENTFKGRCGEFPDALRDLIRAFQPYKGGNTLLWSLNNIRNADEHQMLVKVVPCPVRAANAEITIHLPGSPLSIGFHPPVWNRDKQEITVATTIASNHFGLKCGYTIFIAFDQVEGISGQEVVPALNQLAGQVEAILMALQAETIRTFPAAFS